ncbi:transmembrane protein 208-like [Saccoglossus kowalevskii]|uniref:Transmembrane protein 208 n=1 Tax=Saccoglossus kowalevskii TaxID=10224 RepID=A0ABM0GSB2_SACKO|nr:PREDICTED: transmembrane protein 208-like [Saccoglossus kowalevskii]
MPPKGKVGTKCQKQIYEENKATLKFYRNIVLAANLIYIVVRMVWMWETFNTSCWVLFAFAIAIYVSCMAFMGYMAKSVFNSNGVLVDGGIDLNMESGIAEHIKDVLLVTVIVQVLSIFSNYFWILWFIVPGAALLYIWRNFLSPWLFAPAPEIDEKKQKKMERKMKRR